MDKATLIDIPSKIKLKTPTLIVIGKKEGVFGITVKHHKENNPLEYRNADIYEHDHGHVIPTKSKDYKRIHIFLVD